MIPAPLFAALAVAALAAALLYPMAGPAGAFALRRRRAGAALFLLLASLTLVQLLTMRDYPGALSLVERLDPRPADGSWAALSFDGQPAPPGRYRVAIRRGAVAGGYDDCNHWGYDTENAPPGERLIVSTLVGCPEDDPLRRAYWALVGSAGVRLELVDRNMLRLRGEGHEAIFRRCVDARIGPCAPGEW